MKKKLLCIAFCFSHLLIGAGMGCRQQVAPRSSQPAVTPEISAAEKTGLAPPLEAGAAARPAQTESEQLIEAEGQAEILAGQWSEVDDQLEGDGVLESIIRPYREQLQSAMEEEIGVAEVALERGLPESPLGGFVADAILHHAQTEIDPDADFALMNRGGIRLPELPAGAITVADIYQLVPFDNYVVVLSLSGQQVETLIQTLAAKQGEPMAGIVYQLVRRSDDAEGWMARSIQVGGADLEAEKTYKLATLDYLAGIGGELEVLQAASHRQDGALFLRDVVINEIRDRESVSPVLDGVFLMRTRRVTESLQRRRFLQTMAAAAVVGVPAMGGEASPDSGDPSLVVLHTNDTHSHIDPLSSLYSRNAGLGGAARRAKLINQIRQKHPHVLLLDSGDILQGTPYFNLFGGEVEFKVMSAMKYDVATLGNHEFDNGVDGLVKQMPHADFEFVARTTPWKAHPWPTM